jgi:hypothetical protein
MHNGSGQVDIHCMYVRMTSERDQYPAVAQPRAQRKRGKDRQAVYPHLAFLAPSSFVKKGQYPQPSNTTMYAAPFLADSMCFRRHTCPWPGPTNASLLGLSLCWERTCDCKFGCQIFHRLSLDSSRSRLCSHPGYISRFFHNRKDATNNFHRNSISSDLSVGR